MNEVRTPAANVKAHWLNRERLTIYPRMFVGMFVVLGLAWVLMSKNLVDLNGKPLGYDFITYWAASKLALGGQFADIYSFQSLFMAEKLAVPASQRFYAWYYPPSFLLIVWPLALMPYLAAFWAFMISTLTAYLIVLRRIASDSAAMWCIAAFPGLWVNLFHGQNGFLTASLAAASILCLPVSPVFAGALIAALSFKPHLLILFPVALMAMRAWRSILVLIVITVLIVTYCFAQFGVATWIAWLQSLVVARGFLEDGVLPLAKMPTVFAMARLAGASIAIAYIAHAIVALIAASVVWRVWRQRTGWELRGATLMTASLMISPYLFDYDLAWLAFPIAWLGACGMREGWLKGEREILVASWLLPAVAASLAFATGLQVAPVVLGLLLWICDRRCRMGGEAATRA